MGLDYELKPMSQWGDVGADLSIVDPPFGIEFDGEKSNYRRDRDNVVDGYVEWSEEEYAEKIDQLLDVLERAIVEDGSMLVFSGWNNSHVIANRIKESSLNVEGKLYWSYNFAPYCTRRPAHNVYEIFWITHSPKADWTYSNECSLDHCENGEANLAHFHVKREYHQKIPKYPTRLPIDVVKILVEHFSDPGDLVFDPCAGSGVIGIGAKQLGREARLGDVNKEALTVFDECKSYYGVGGAVA